MKSEEVLASVLHARNRAIIDAVIAKAKKVCPGALDLIAITGSFASGEFYEKSDLDLLIVINDPAGGQLAKCFVLGDVGHDIYCQTRKALEHTATYPDPHVAKLLDAEIIYCRDEEVDRWYRQLRDELRARMAAAPDTCTLNAIHEYMKDAWQNFGRLCAEQDFGRCRYFAAGVLYRIEYAVYMLNGAYIRRGIRGIPDEICALPSLPDGFAEHYHALIDAKTAEDIRRETAVLIRTTDRLIKEAQARIRPRMPLTSSALRGTHEEIHSNWRNKMYRAAAEDDRYLAWMTEAATQKFYNDMAKSCDMAPITLMTDEPCPDLLTRAHRFDDAMRRYGENYVRTGTPFCRYDRVEDFVTDYLK